jgi:HTH-type transcriptional regulator, sugar sensing transcriptional regulator
MAIKDILADLGLKDKKADVYLACLELGSATASQIAKKAGIKRPYFYDIAEYLLQNNLITQTRKGKHRYFSAISPDKLKANEEEKLKKLDEILPELKSIYKTTGAKPKIYFYEGKEGIAEINKDTLHYKGEMVGFSTERFLTAEEKKLSQNYIQTRIKNKIKARVIGPVSNDFLGLKKRDSEELRETKMLPRDLYESDVEFTIYGNKIAIVSYKENFGFIIESSDVVKPLRMIFELIWRGGFVVN